MRVLSLAPSGAEPRRARALERARAEARLLRGAGHEVWLATPQRADADERSVLAFVRGDRLPDHWHKSRDPGCERALMDTVRDLGIELVHVHHWQGLSRSLVLAAARAGVPAVVSLHDAWIACPIGSRVRPAMGACDAVVGAHPCLACAAETGPRTPWVPMEQSFLALAERQRDLQRELELARVRWITSPELALQLERWLGAPLRTESMFEPELERLVAGYRAALVQGAPRVAAEEWFEARMQAEAQRNWDEQYDRARAETEA
jgi:hypothetical protein